MACREGERYRIDFLEDLLSEDDRVRYARHAAGCEECARAIAEERAILAMVRAPAREAPSAPVRADIVRRARLAADRAPRRRFRDIFESPLLQTVALATLVVGIAFVFEDQLPHAGLPSLKETLRTRFGPSAEESGGGGDATPREKRAAPAPRPTTEGARAAAKPAPPPPTAPSESPAMALRDAGPTRAPEAPTSGASPSAPPSAAARAPSLPAAPAPDPGRSGERTVPEADAFADREWREEAADADAPSPRAEIRTLIDAKEWREALERVDAALAREREPDEAIALLDLGIEAADALGDDVRSVRYRVERLAHLRARETAADE